MAIPYSEKVNERIIGQAIVNESHLVGIIGIATYASAQINLIEVPQGPFPAVTVTGAGGPYTEIATPGPIGGQFYVNYTTGVVTFDPAKNGDAILVSYTGLGSEIAAQDINEVQDPISSIMTLNLIYNSPFTSAAATWNLAPDLAVTSLNGLQNAVTLGAGANITITPSGNTLIIASTGGGGSTPGGANGSVQFNILGTSLGGDAANFYWDSTNLRLGLRTGTSPISTIDNAGSLGLSIRTTTVTSGASATDYTILCDATSGAINVPLPIASTVARRVYVIKKIDSSANLVTVVAGGVDTIDGAATFPMSVQWQSATVQSNGTNWFII